ncbi:WD40 repeat-like protein [Pluteus cervinus]|uniref:WD40 repeat-like protein n=1 Tax=Pluteus cervinus TaxID=181527 RepID=A0ACD3A3Z4_9AGAR|nr:WD40 repeat-like protein [Pluteus cervinus]
MDSVCNSLHSRNTANSSCTDSELENRLYAEDESFIPPSQIDAFAMSRDLEDPDAAQTPIDEPLKFLNELRQAIPQWNRIRVDMVSTSETTKTLLRRMNRILDENRLMKFYDSVQKLQVLVTEGLPVCSYSRDHTIRLIGLEPHLLQQMNDIQNALNSHLPTLRDETRDIFTGHTNQITQIRSELAQIQKHLQDQNLSRKYEVRILQRSSELQRIRDTGMPAFKQEALQYKRCRKLDSGEHDGSILALGLNSGGTVLACGGEDGKITFWRVRDGALLHVLQSSSDTAISCLLWLNETQLLAGSTGGLAFCVTITATEIKCILVITGHSSTISSIDAKSTQCATGAGNEVVIWTHRNGTDWTVSTILKNPPEQDHPTVRVVSLQWLPSKNILAVSYEYHGIVLWEAENGRIYRTIGSNGGIISISPSRGPGSWEQLTAVSISAPSVSLYDVGKSTQFIGKLSGEPSAIVSLGPYPVNFIHDGKAVVAGDPSGRVHIWDVATKRVVQFLRHDKAVTALAAHYNYDEDVFYIASVQNGTMGSEVVIWKTIDIAKDSSMILPEKTYFLASGLVGWALFVVAFAVSIAVWMNERITPDIAFYSGAGLVVLGAVVGFANLVIN